MKSFAILVAFIGLITQVTAHPVKARLVDPNQHFCYDNPKISWSVLYEMSDIYPKIDRFCNSIHGKTLGPLGRTEQIFEFPRLDGGEGTFPASFEYTRTQPVDGTIDKDDCINRFRGMVDSCSKGDLSKFRGASTRLPDQKWAAWIVCAGISCPWRPWRDQPI
ncbi:hypothetical protein AJ80_03013 [Polytolypa hystricis UAMH7299]|uniref:Ecp2 effector protein domain-containing protein n=1 Tax=Polytolypa hystricis (strain UAMH7299) TaxID=1447883 RepID=A0A2B7YFW1_POLH7|nr:hypothetical protein AJ80_03013 [Polytolypa hystricis UAMH7299]